MKSSPALSLHGVLLAVYGKGVLLTGEPSCGKSETALALLSRGHQLVADDAPLFSRQQQRWMGVAANTQKGLLCVRNLGLIDITLLYGPNALKAEMPLDLIIHLDNELYKLPPQNLEFKLDNRVFDGIAVPTLTIQIATSHNIAILIETAVKLAFMPQSARIESIIAT